MNEPSQAPLHLAQVRKAVEDHLARSIREQPATDNSATVASEPAPHAKGLGTSPDQCPGCYRPLGESGP